MNVRTYGPYAAPPAPQHKWTRLVLTAESIDDGHQITREAVAWNAFEAWASVTSQFNAYFRGNRWRPLTEGHIVESADPPMPALKPTRCAW